MADILPVEDPEPLDAVPAGPLYVPVRPGPTGCAARLFRTPFGERTVVAFTTRRRLGATLGRAQAWVRLCEPALRALAAPIGVTRVTVDPAVVTPASAPSAPRPTRTAGRPAVTLCRS
ncbi:SAV_915 family protein [Streptomyces purpurogeneiscleroticus]|uniref:SAV_915 family protein n=1 Tax=Streptomyces purpurogeneiscleroticus TaxID=68259 RepID=UPI001CC18775|nr:SAV_915 family protein [Streptomyces purpurogeneiscleroticus]MBZ4019003.1 hypothetical protein [Streptomyces purpurogeneiscleroticus]